MKLINYQDCVAVHWRNAHVVPDNMDIYSQRLFPALESPCYRGVAEAGI